MININMVTKSAVNKNSILSVNTINCQGTKNKNNIQSVMKSHECKTQTNTISSVQQNIVCPYKAVPKLYNSIQKGQKVVLSTIPLSKIEVCLGWNTTNKMCDVDVSAFLLGENEKVLGDDWFVFYGQTTSPDKSIEFVSESNTDRQKIRINFNNIDKRIQKIVFVLTINEAFEKQLHFGMIKDAYVRIMNQQNHELVSFVMTEYYTNVISMMIGELYIHKGAWKFNAVGNGVAKDLAGLCKLYGVEVV